MIARVQTLTGLEFDAPAVKSNTKPKISGEVLDSTKGIWLFDHYFPHYRVILSPVAIHHGYFSDTEDPDEEHINERVHWSVIEKREARTLPAYTPRNLPAEISTEKIAAITDQERALLSQSE